MKVENCGRSIFSNPLSLVLYARISIAVYGKYRAALRHIDCAFGANIDLHKYPLIHRRRDDGPRSSAEPPPFRHAKGVPPFPLSGKSTPQRFFQNRGKVGMDGEYRGATSFFIQNLASRAGEGWYGWRAPRYDEFFHPKLDRTEQGKVGMDGEYRGATDCSKNSAEPSGRGWCLRRLQCSN